MDLDFSFTLRTSVRSTVKEKTKPISGQNKRLLSSTRRKHWQGLFVNNEIDLQQTNYRSEKHVKDISAPAKQHKPNVFSVEVKENFDPSCFGMNTNDQCAERTNLRKSKLSLGSQSDRVNTSIKHDSSGEKDFIELAKVSLRKHQRSLYKRNIKDGKLFYKKNVIANFTEFIEKSFVSNNSSENRKFSDEVIQNGLRVSERLKVDRSALHVDNGDDNDLFGGSISSTSSKLEIQTKKVDKSCLDKVVTDGKNGKSLTENGFDQSLVVSSPSLLSDSLLGCRPLSNERKRPRNSLEDSSQWSATRPKKRSAKENILRSKTSFNDSESIYFESLKTKVKSVMNSSNSLSECVPSPNSPKPKSTSNSFIDCISASDSDDHNCSHGKTVGLTDEPGDSVCLTNRTRKSVGYSRKNLPNIADGKGTHTSSTLPKRKSSSNRFSENVNKATNSDELKNSDSKLTSGSILEDEEDTKNITRCDSLKENHSFVKDVIRSSIKLSDVSPVKSQVSTRSSRRRSSRKILDASIQSSNLCTVNASCASVDIFDDSRLSEVRSMNIPVSDEIEDRSRSSRMCGRKSVGKIDNKGGDGRAQISLDSSSSSVSGRSHRKNSVKQENCNGKLVNSHPITRSGLERKPYDEILMKNTTKPEESCDSSLKTATRRSKIAVDSISFTKPKTPVQQLVRRKSCRLSGINNLCKDDSWVSKDMFESDIEDERSKSMMNFSKDVDTNKVEIVIRDSDCRTQQVHCNISESVKTRKNRKSSVNTDKPLTKISEKVDCDAGYVTPSLPKTKLLEIAKWLTDSEKSIRHTVPSTSIIAPPDFNGVTEEEISDNCTDKVNTLKTPKTKTDKQRSNKNATDKQATKTKTKTEKRSKKVKDGASDRDDASSQVKTFSNLESNAVDNKEDCRRPVTANVGVYTEPKKPKKKRIEVQPSFTEKKPTKTSMFSSSSSSEDLFEKFLEDEKKKRLSRLKRVERFNKLSVEKFIYDGSSSEEDNSLAFYNDFISSEVKKDVDCLSEGKWSNHSAESNRLRHAHPRRLSFESQDSGSDRAAINNALKTTKLPDTTLGVHKPKKRTPDKISKKRLPFRISPKYFLGSNKKSAKKTNSVKKTHEDRALEQIKRINDNKKLIPTTPSTDKSSTKKVAKTPLTTGKPAGSATPQSTRRREELFTKTPAKNLSFLSSLSVLVDGDRCHPDAVQYKKNFKKLKEELAKKLFVLYNREVFKNRLPEDMPIEWNSRMRSTSGYCFNKRTIKGGEVTRSARIQLSSKILDAPDRLRDTLIHEMCHAATWLLDGVKDAHGPTWKNWTLEAMRRFPELPRIKVCHDYKINTKYSYKCLGCGYSVGRHSKSLDIEHKRCGYCYGKFELVVNVKARADKKVTGKKVSDKDSDTATTSTTTRTPRAPTGFALFVKENYAKIKQENANLAHKDVMKVLSERFAKVKLTNKAIKEEEEDDNVLER